MFFLSFSMHIRPLNCAGFLEADVPLLLQLQFLALSQLYLHEFKVSQHDQCIMTVTVLPETSSGKHKIKIAGIMISEEGGSEGLKNGMAIDMVMEGMSSGNDAQTSFDMRTWVSAPLTDQLKARQNATAD